MPRSPSKPASNSRKFAEGAGRRGEAWAALFLNLQVLSGRWRGG